MSDPTKTLRDEFAIGALASCYAWRMRLDFVTNERHTIVAAEIAHDAYKIADAMLEERVQP